MGTGTSGATAIIAGAAALVRAKYPDLSATEVIHRLTATADDKGPPGRDDEYGYGVVNLVRALTANVPPLTPSTSPTAASDSTGAAPPNGKDSGSGINTAAIVVGALIVAMLCAGGWWTARRRRAG